MKARRGDRREPERLSYHRTRERIPRAKWVAWVRTVTGLVAAAAASACGGAATGDAGRPVTEGSLLPFIATGHEPEWRLEMTTRQMTLLTDLGQSRLVAPTPGARPGGAERVYASEGDDGPITVRIEAGICSDSMSGMPHPNRVVVEAAGDVLRGCGGEPSDLLEGGAWTVVELAGRGVMDGSRITLTFDEGRVAGHASCNEYTAEYGLTGEGLRIGEIIRTERACAPALMEQEEAFLARLGGVARFAIGDDGSLRLHAGSGQPIVAVR